MPFLPVTHASISLPLPIAPPRTFAAPRALECPRELRLARLGDPEPSGPLELDFVSLSESGEGASRRLPPPLAAGGVEAGVGAGGVQLGGWRRKGWNRDEKRARGS